MDCIFSIKTEENLINSIKSFGEMGGVQEIWGSPWKANGAKIWLQRAIYRLIDEFGWDGKAAFSFVNSYIKK